MSNPAKESSPKTRSRRLREVRVLTWSQVDKALLAYFVSALTDEGCAVLFTKTRDGGTLVVQAFSGETKLKDYISDYQEASMVLNWMLDDLGCLEYTVQVIKD